MEKKRRLSDVASPSPASASGAAGSGGGEDADAENWAHEGADAAARPRRVTRTILAAIILFTVGSVMLYFGVQALPHERDRGLAMVITGAIAFVPGAYACVIIVGTLLGWRDYDYRDLPSYDHD